MNSNVKAVLLYALALLGPVIGFVGIGQNANERYPVLVFLVCIGLWAAAGYFSFPGSLSGSKLKWFGLSVALGIIEACMLVFMV